jgi:hypothetical protein
MILVGYGIGSTVSVTYGIEAVGEVLLTVIVPLY